MRRGRGLLTCTLPELPGMPTRSNPGSGIQCWWHHRCMCARVNVVRSFQLTPHVSELSRYEWYFPSIGRLEATNRLRRNHWGPGSFLIRDLVSNPGWHMLAVKLSETTLNTTSGASEMPVRVQQDKIRRNPDGSYELLPSLGQAASAPQPRFPDIVELVEYYRVRRDGMTYHLVVPRDSVYDSHSSC